MQHLDLVQRHSQNGLVMDRGITMKTQMTMLKAGTIATQTSPGDITLQENLAGLHFISNNIVI